MLSTITIFVERCHASTLSRVATFSIQWWHVANLKIYRQKFILEFMIAGGFIVPWGAQDSLKVKAGEIFWSLVRWRAERSGCEEVEQAAAERCRHSIRPRRALTPSLHPFTAPHTVPLILWHPRAYEAQQHFSMPPKLPHYRAPYIPIPIPTTCTKFKKKWLQRAENMVKLRVCTYNSQKKYAYTKWCLKKKLLTEV